jgi:hypothetical protein
MTNTMLTPLIYPQDVMPLNRQYPRKAHYNQVSAKHFGNLSSDNKEVNRPTIDEILSTIAGKFVWIRNKSGQLVRVTKEQAKRLFTANPKRLDQ